MDAQNLAICLAPSLFYIRSMSTGHPNWRRKTITTGFPSEKELKENRAAQLCLGTMIRHYDQIFQISEDVLRSCCFDKNIENRLHFVVSDQGATFDLSSHYTVCCNSLIKLYNLLLYNVDLAQRGLTKWSLFNKSLDDYLLTSTCGTACTSRQRFRVDCLPDSSWSTLSLYGY
ncbi:StAR-related lipid transfer protein 13 [Trichinella pseudospiralis]|uniref:StAR-related lipid transfer protein 13 n=1 Tax=Trichinella pseudospiralis TaxID=6337 RepID=A0A0V0YKV7_TRIPS|nr:StAR-related lipid transfer protein 13 [Trichinella pseudospiralis]